MWGSEGLGVWRQAQAWLLIKAKIGKGREYWKSTKLCGMNSLPSRPTNEKNKALMFRLPYCSLHLYSDEGYSMVAETSVLYSSFVGLEGKYRNEY